MIERTYVKCEICGANIRESRMNKHIKKVHSAEAEEIKKIRLAKRLAKNLEKQKEGEKLVACEFCGAFIMKKDVNKHIKTNHKKQDTIVITSKSSIRSRVTRKCSRCGKLGAGLWVYNLTSSEPIYLCKLCRPKVIEKSFGKKKIEQYCVSAGAFESNRRKH